MYFCFTCTSPHMHQGFGLQGIKLQYRYTFEIKKNSYISIKYLKKKYFELYFLVGNYI